MKGNIQLSFCKYHITPTFTISKFAHSTKQHRNVVMCVWMWTYSLVWKTLSVNYCPVIKFIRSFNAVYFPLGRYDDDADGFSRKRNCILCLSTQIYWHFEIGASAVVCNALAVIRFSIPSYYASPLVPFLRLEKRQLRLSYATNRKMNSFMLSVESLFMALLFHFAPISLLMYPFRTWLGR